MPIKQSFKSLFAGACQPFDLGAGLEHDKCRHRLNVARLAHLVGLVHVALAKGDRVFVGWVLRQRRENRTDLVARWAPSSEKVDDDSSASFCGLLDQLLEVGLVGDLDDLAGVGVFVAPGAD